MQPRCSASVHLLSEMSLERRGVTFFSLAAPREHQVGGAREDIPLFYDIIESQV